MKLGRSLQDLALELDRQAAAKKDLVVPSRKLVSHTSPSGDCVLEIDERDGPGRYLATDRACSQIAKRLDIPFSYFKRMRGTHPELLDLNVNGWLRVHSADTYMVRTLDGRARAFLSNSYRRIDHIDLAQSILPILRQLPGARFESVELTESKLYLKVISAKVECEVQPGDVLQAGVVVSNSEVGCGRLRVEPLIYRLICRNGLIACDRTLRKNHAGKRLVADEEVMALYQEDTLEAEDKAIFLKVRDMVQCAVSEATFALISEKMRKTMGIPLQGDPVRTVEVLSNRYSLSEEERAGVLRRLLGEGDMSGYGLVNAITGYAQEVVDYDRATEFEELGGRLLELEPGEWKGLMRPA